jgi:hypothetical protein
MHGTQHMVCMVHMICMVHSSPMIKKPLEYPFSYCKQQFKKCKSYSKHMRFELTVSCNTVIFRTVGLGSVVTVFAT